MVKSKVSKLTKMACIQEALKFQTRTDWAKKSGTSYNVAADMGWLAECTRHMVVRVKPAGYWTMQNCLSDAKRFTSRSEWAKKSGTAYNTALANGWLETCTQHMIRKMKPSGYWNKRQCQSEAKKFTSSSEWQKKSASSYAAAVEHGWLPDCTKHFSPKKMPNGYWTKSRCFQEAKKYTSKVEFENGSRGAYHAALDNGWIDEVCSHMVNHRKHEGYSLIELQDEASKHETKKSFRSANPKMVLWATRKGLMDQICKHMKPLGSRSRRQLYAFEHPDKTAYVGLSYDAKKRYEQHINSSRVDTVGLILREKKAEFGDRQIFKIFPGFFGQKEAAAEEKRLVAEYEKAGWKMLNSAKAGSLGGNVTKYTLEECVRIARQCQKRSEVEKLNPSAYHAIKKFGWQKQCYAHMDAGKKIKYSDAELLAVIRKVSSLTELSEKFPLEYRAASRRPNFREWTRHLSRQRKIHTNQDIFKAAKKCKTRMEFFNNFGDEYRAAKRRGIFEQAVAHMKPRKDSI